MTLDQVKGLPVGTVVANNRNAFIKSEMDLGLDQLNWRSTLGLEVADHEIFVYLNGQLPSGYFGKAVVLRIGHPEA